ncbi:MAG TPA: hypothetical protein VF131_13135 [Blastocatellia bacterium]|nr:hypothetical protein [Blastocatellia bacterium]
MPPEIEKFNQEPYSIFTDEEADRLVTGALDTSPDEPEPFVKLLLILHDHEKDSRLQDSIRLLMRVAYNCSIVHSIKFEEYLEAIRQGQAPLEEARAKLKGSQDTEA